MGKRAAGKQPKAKATSAVAAAPDQVDATPKPLVLAPAPSQVNQRNTEYPVAVQEFGDLSSVDTTLTDDVPSIATLCD